MNDKKILWVSACNLTHFVNNKNQSWLSGKD